MDWGQFLRAGGRGPLRGSNPEDRELVEYYNRVLHAPQNEKSRVSFAGRYYPLAAVATDERLASSARAPSVHIPGHRAVFGVNNARVDEEATLVVEAEKKASFLQLPVPLLSTDKAMEGFTGHLPRTVDLFGMTTAERVRRSDEALRRETETRARGSTRLTTEPGTQPHAGFPVRHSPASGLSYDRLRLVEEAKAKEEAAARSARTAALTAVRPARPGGVHTISRTESSRLALDMAPTGARGSPVRRSVGPRVVKRAGFAVR